MPMQAAAEMPASESGSWQVVEPGLGVRWRQEQEP